MDDREIILLVEDEMNVRETLLMAFEDDDYKEILLAENGEQALDVLENFPVHLVVTDLNMPQMSGVDFCQEIRQRLNPVPVIVLSGEIKKSDYEALSKLGVNDFIQKPFDLDYVTQLIQSTVTRQKRLFLEADLFSEIGKKLGIKVDYNSLGDDERIDLIRKISVSLS